MAASVRSRRGEDNHSSFYILLMNCSLVPACAQFLTIRHYNIPRVWQGCWILHMRGIRKKMQGGVNELQGHFSRRAFMPVPLSQSIW